MANFPSVQQFEAACTTHRISTFDGPWRGILEALKSLNDNDTVRHNELRYNTRLKEVTRNIELVKASLKPGALSSLLGTIEREAAQEVRESDERIRTFKTHAREARNVLSRILPTLTAPVMLSLQSRKDVEQFVLQFTGLMGPLINSADNFRDSDVAFANLNQQKQFRGPAFDGLIRAWIACTASGAAPAPAAPSGWVRATTRTTPPTTPWTTATATHTPERRAFDLAVANARRFSTNFVQYVEAALRVDFGVQ